MKADVWQYIAFGCNQDKGRPSLLCFVYNWRSASDFSKKELNLYNSTYTESLTDLIMIGDTVCSFTGWLKSFSIFQGSTNFMDSNYLYFINYKFLPLRKCFMRSIFAIWHRIISKYDSINLTINSYFMLYRNCYKS